jgi:hypothetical protein
VLFGDSIFYKVGISNALGDYNAVNLASPGFFIENLLHRMDNPQLSPLKDAPVVAIMIGGFNVGARDSPEAVANGLKAVAKLTKTKFSKSSKIVLFSILPRNSKVLNTDIFEINHALAYFADQPDLDFYFVDLTNRFWDVTKGSVTEKMFESDKFTLSTDGLALLKSTLDQIIKEPLVKAPPPAEKSPATDSGDPVTIDTSRNTTSRAESESNVPPALPPDDPVVSIRPENPNPDGITIELSSAKPSLGGEGTELTSSVSSGGQAVATIGTELHEELHVTPPIILRHNVKPNEVRKYHLKVCPSKS